MENANPHIHMFMNILRTVFTSWKWNYSYGIKLVKKKKNNFPFDVRCPWLCACQLRKSLHRTLCVYKTFYCIRIHTHSHKFTQTLTQLWMQFQNTFVQTPVRWIAIIVGRQENGKNAQIYVTWFIYQSNSRASASFP